MEHMNEPPYLITTNMLSNCRHPVVFKLTSILYEPHTRSKPTAFMYLRFASMNSSTDPTQ